MDTVTGYHRQFLEYKGEMFFELLLKNMATILFILFVLLVWYLLDKAIPYLMTHIFRAAGERARNTVYKDDEIRRAWLMYRMSTLRQLTTQMLRVLLATVMCFVILSAIGINVKPILAGIGMTITASKGTKWMNMLSNIAVPIVLIFGFISIIRAFNDVGGVAGINALVKEDSITFAKAVALGVGSYVVGSVMFTPDIMRFAKNAKTSIIVMIITIMVGNSFMVFFGAIGSVVYGDPDIMGVLALQGLLAPAFIVMVLNIWSTAQGCVYSGSMSLSSVIKVPRNKLTLVFGLVGTILGCVGFYNLFGSYINFLSSTVPPIVGIVFADFLTKYNHGYTDLDSLPRADIGGFVSWIVGVAVTFIPVLLPSINCVVVAFLVKVIFNKVGKKQ